MRMNLNILCYCGEGGLDFYGFLRIKIIVRGFVLYVIYCREC